MENDLKVLIQETKRIEVKIDEKSFYVNAKLSLEKTIDLSQIIAEKLIKYALKLKTVKEDANNLEAIFQFLKILDKKEVSEILAVVIDQTAEVCAKLDIDLVSKLIIYLYENNYESIKDLLKNWSGIIAKTKAEVKENA